MGIFEAIIYGIIQGLSEFLPISSSGHLALLPHVMNIKDPGVVFDLFMHIGTAGAVIACFWKEILKYIKVFTPQLANYKVGGEDRWFVRNFIYATFVSVFFIVILVPVSKLARDPWIIIFNLSLFGGILWLADSVNRKKGLHLESPMTEKMQWKLAGLIGLAQAMAIFPGVSRSGITLTMALFLGMRRKEAGTFSFLLSLPIIFAGILKEVPDLMKTQNSDGFIVLLSGVGASFIVGYLTVHYFMKLIGKIELKYFAFYRWLVAALMIWTLL
ncbi:MAG: undecaprenyl-diphosphate phosphatase [Bacteriovoracaceae bacterium]